MSYYINDYDVHHQFPMPSTSSTMMPSTSSSYNFYPAQQQTSHGAFQTMASSTRPSNLFATPAKRPIFRDQGFFKSPSSTGADLFPTSSPCPHGGFGSNQQGSQNFFTEPETFVPQREATSAMNSTLPHGCDQLPTSYPSQPPHVEPPTPVISMIPEDFQVPNLTSAGHF